jgi:hypothetical protein
MFECCPLQGGWQHGFPQSSVIFGYSPNWISSFEMLPSSSSSSGILFVKFGSHYLGWMPSSSCIFGYVANWDLIISDASFFWHLFVKFGPHDSSSRMLLLHLVFCF